MISNKKRLKKTTLIIIKFEHNNTYKDKSALKINFNETVRDTNDEKIKNEKKKSCALNECLKEISETNSF